ncbi:phosphopyruvate hydratase [Conexibacter woesei]|uniref:Enolase n=1 Tax=Conexibacter woesei (strain DSM 14684 / CCUG 47730 / CIP 108061 / JCM 11494 / NBRC 100937 / ID131577) TaxID=469383 RepID=D3F4F0_CONWI|nr:phosphopyruvate hydratase [Conexibacter woesei]ADB50522.1 enolase [Conexibacter woesei DSM 14684]
MSRIATVRGREVLDSRGRPTVEAEVVLDDGVRVHASVPSGASTGRHEAHELRDGDLSRYRGRGVRTAVANVRDLLEPAVAGLDPTRQEEVDAALIAADGTPEKSRAGANAVLAVSLAVARAGACSRGIPLWQHLIGDEDPVMPRPMINLISGGLHARRNLDLQDFLIVPVGAATYPEALEASSAVIEATGEILRERGLSTLHADEGGFGPALAGHRDALELAATAVERAGLRLGDDVAFALDVAATHFQDPATGLYDLTAEGRVVDAAGMVDLLEGWMREFPIVSIEDPLAEDDWDGWKLASERLGRSAQVVGDDLFTTNATRLRRGVRDGAANSVLVKMNQIGTLSETLALAELARAAGYGIVVSARSGETEDDALADLAVAARGGQIKVGSLTQSERLAKYNRLLRILDEVGPHTALPRWEWAWAR